MSMDGEAVDGVGGLTGGRREVLDGEREERAVGKRVPVEEQEQRPFAGHDATLVPRSYGSPMDPHALTAQQIADLNEAAAIHGRLGIRILEASPQRVVGTMPVEGNTQPYGLLHGGASVLLAESLGSYGSALHAGAGFIAVGIEINATHHRAVTSGVVTGTATPVHLGRTVATWETVVVDDRDRRVCTARLTCLIRPAQAAPGEG